MLRKLCWILFAAALSSGMSFAQSTLGTLLGTVTDPSGGVIRNCNVKIVLNEEGTSRTLTTDVNGNYEALNSKPGHYTLEVSAHGFQTSKVEALELLARQTLRLDVTLQLGQMAQTMEVTASNAGVINTDTETISSAVNALQIGNLPTNYRASGNGNSPYYLLEILPGMQSDQNGNLSVQGGLQSQSQFTVDGISTTDVTGNSPLHNAFPSGESISEMKLQGVGAPAEFGDPGDVTTVSKSGTNTLHGSIFWYHQNAALDAIAFGSTSKTAKVANDFGGSTGGPVVIPNLYNGKNKTFFFADYEGFRLPRTSTIQNTVPTSAMRTGDESYLCSSGFDSSGVCLDRNSAGGVTDQIYNPYTGEAFKNNQIPSEMINSATTKFLSLYPLPNNASTFTNNNYNVNRPANLTSNGFDGRGDQYFSQKLSLFGRYTYKNIPSLSPQELSIPSSTNYEHVRMLVTSATYTIKPTLLNEFRFGLTNDHTGKTNPYDGKSFTTALGFENINNLWFNGLPDISFTGMTQALNVDRMNSVGQSQAIEFTDSLSWVKDRHTFKFGMDAQKIRAVSALGFFGADNYGGFVFKGTFTNDDFSDFLLGLPGESDLDNVTMDNDGRSHRFALFAQDSFRVTPRLTLEYGLRWEYHPGYTDASGQVGNFDDSVSGSGAVVYPNGHSSLLATSFLQSFDACPNSALPGLASDPTSANGAACTPVRTASEEGIPQGLRTTSKRFMPRFGFAYKPFHNDKTVVRGGIGAYQASTMGSVYYSLTGTLQAYTNTYENTLTNKVPGFVWPNTSAGEAAGASYGTAYFGTANSIHWKEPYSVQWNLSVERDLGRGMGLRLSYIGMKTTNLVWAPNLNQSRPNSTTPYAEQPLSSRPFPNWGIVNTRSIGASANYNAAQAELTRRVGTGLTLDSTYTWSRNLADNQGTLSNGGLCGETACNRAADLYDRRSEYGNTYTPTHSWISTVIYQLPVGTGKHFANTTNKVLNGVIGGWQTNNVFLVRSGPWLTPYFSGGDPSGTGSGIIGRAQHPDRIGAAYPGKQNSSEWLLSSGFECPTGNCKVGTTSTGAPAPIGRFGTSGVGTLLGPGTINWDLGVSKNFQLTERARLRVEVSFVNVMNHINLGNPDMKITDTNNPSAGKCGFGCITAAQGLYQFAGARTGQIGARIDF